MYNYVVDMPIDWQWELYFNENFLFSVNDENSPLLGNGHSENGAESRLRYSANTESLPPMTSIENPILAENPDGQHDHDHDHTHMDGVFHHSTLRSLILLMALSFHSVFEGLAIGLQESLSQLISLFLAVIAHKGNFYYLS